jgi:hypothetical protein
VARRVGNKIVVNVDPELARFDGKSQRPSKRAVRRYREQVRLVPRRQDGEPRQFDPSADAKRIFASGMASGVPT